MIKNKIVRFFMIILGMKIILVQFLFAETKTLLYSSGLFLIVIIVTIAVIIVIIAKLKRQKSVLNKLSDEKPSIENVKAKILKNNLDFDCEEFLKKVEVIFNEVHKAKETQDLSRIKRYVSDGLYQWFSTLFIMMSILKQKIKVDKVELKNIYINRLENDGVFDIIHIGINALVVDNIISSLDSSLNLNASGTITEYWLFMKKKDSPKSDWILVDIIQANDYIGIIKKLQKYHSILDNLPDTNGKDGFCIKEIEDKVINGYLQILTSITLQDMAIIRRFITNELFEKLKMQIKMQEKGKPIVYNRVCINDITLIGMNEKDNEYVLVLAVKSSFQRVKVVNNKPAKIDEAILANNNIILLTRSKSALQPKGLLYMHECPNCGAAVKDSIKIECPKCNVPLNNSKNEWIISDIMNMHEYNRFLSENKSDIVFKSTPELLDELYDVRDYAFNNVMIMIAIDGIFEKKEEEFARSLAKKWGYNIKKIEPMFEMAKSGKLSIRMPENPKQRSRIIKLMEKAASADENISVEEQQLLNNVKEKYINDK